MSIKKRLSKDQPLQDFIKAGGRDHAEADFNTILIRAVKPIKKSNQKPKTK